MSSVRVDPYLWNSWFWGIFKHSSHCHHFKVSDLLWRCAFWWDTFFTDNFMLRKFSISWSSVYWQFLIRRSVHFTLYICTNRKLQWMSVKRQVCRLFFCLATIHCLFHFCPANSSSCISFAGQCRPSTVKKIKGILDEFWLPETCLELIWGMELGHSQKSWN